jgi:hypothetical protein
MTLLKARKRPDNSYRVVVHLDASKTLDGAPDPAWCRQYDWGPTPAGMTQANYVAQLKQETKLLCALELAKMVDDEGTALGGEGTPL